MSEPFANPELKAQVESAPLDPGTYRFRNAEGQVLYVGKAKCLRKRVRSYFREGGDGRFLVEHLKREIHSVDFIVTSTEKEALLLENTLIKRDRPLYNINFRDDKSFVSLRIDPEAEIPRLSVVRTPRDDGARYFGPYSSSSAVRATVKFISKYFGVRPCSDGFYRAHSERPCLKYQIGRCAAPCCGHISLDDHRQLARDVVLFLEGRRGELVRDLERQMKEAAKELEFEKAASLRDQVAAIRKTIEGQIVSRTIAEDVDVVGHHVSDGRIEVALLFIRQRSLVSTRTVSFKTSLEPAEVIASFLSQYYGLGHLVPESVVVPCELPEVELLEALLGERRGKRVLVRVPQRGEKRRLMELARRNAEASARTRDRLEKETLATLTGLQEELGLPAPPRRIECFDISTLQGTATVASMVVFVNGQPERDEYRRFRVRTIEGQDDFSSLAEVVSRRYTRALEEELDLPDLVVIDGGRGQLSAALGALRELGLEEKLPVIGLAKARRIAGGSEPARSDERVILPHIEHPLHLAQDSPENLLLVRVRDEAHRFAITYHRRVRAREGIRSDLDAIPGIGRERKRQLLEHFGSLEKIRSASVEELSRLPGISQKRARRIVEALAPPPESPEPLPGDETGSGTT